MLRVRLQPSRCLAIILTGAHMGAAVALFPLDMPLWGKLALAALVAASLARALWRHALLRSRAAPVAIELREHDRAAVQTSDGLWHEAKVVGTTYVSPLLSVLNLRLEDSTFARHIIIVPDNVDAEDFRRLRVRLRWGYRREP